MAKIEISAAASGEIIYLVIFETDISPDKSFPHKVVAIQFESFKNISFLSMNGNSSENEFKYKKKPLKR